MNDPDAPSSPVPDRAGDLPPPPDGWADDKLSAFFDMARNNSFATFVRKPAYGKLSEIDACFLEIGTNLRDNKSLVPSMLLHRCHASFRAAAMLAVSGFGPEVFPILRQLIEAASYALHMEYTPGLPELWLRRHDSDEAKQAVRSAFTAGAVKRTVSAKAPKLAAVFELLYERSIDFGAHMNEWAITGSMTMAERPNEIEYQNFFLSAGTSLDHAVKSLAQAGVYALSMFDIIFSSRFMLLGLSDRLRELKRDL